jgi:hypothetical protein
VTVAALGAESETAKTAFTVPEFPSVAVALAIEIVGGESSFVIVPVPIPVLAMLAFDGLVRLTVKISFASTVASPVTGTRICLAVWPGVKVSVPDVTA